MIDLSYSMFAILNTRRTEGKGYKMIITFYTMSYCTRASSFLVLLLRWLCMAIRKIVYGLFLVLPAGAVYQCSS